MNAAAPQFEKTTATALGQQIAQRSVSSVSVTEYFLDRIERLNAQTNSYVSVLRDTALADAAEVDRRIAAGEKLSPLAGVPIAVKDVLCTRGERTTCSSRMLESFRPPYDSTVIERLKKAGVILLGKTNMDEFAMGGSTENSIFGSTKNPWDLQRTAGGSSGGSAAALAAGLAPFSIGSDTGGSVRQPASFCGVLGMKPTYGRISRYGLIAFASSLDQVGPFAKTSQDMAALMEIIAGHDPRDSTSLDAPVEAYTQKLEQPLKGLRIGIVREQIESPGLSVEVRSAVEYAAETLRTLGATIVDAHLPNAEHMVPTYYLIAPCEASSNLARYDGAHYGYRAELKGREASLETMYCRSRSEGFGPEVKRRIMLGTYALSAGYYDAYYKKALQVRRLIWNDYRDAFAGADVLLGPTTPSTAFKIGEKIDDPVQMYLEDLFTVGANLAGIPAISLPAGLTSSRLPVGIQLQGPPLSEARLLSITHQLERAGFTAPQL